MRMIGMLMRTYVYLRRVKPVVEPALLVWSVVIRDVQIELF